MDEKARPCQTHHLKMPLNVRLRAATGQYWRPQPTSTANKKGHYILLILTECRWTPLVAGLTKVFWHDFGNDCGHFQFQLCLMSWIFSFRYILCVCFLINFFSCLGILRWTYHYPVVNISIFVQTSLKLDKIGQIYLTSLLNCYIS